MAELADAADSKSAEVHPSWGFNSPSRHQHFWGQQVTVARTVRSRSGLNPSMTSPVNRFSATFSSVHPLSQFDCVVSFGLFNPEYGFKKYLLYSRQAAGRGCSPLTPKNVTRAADPVKLT